MALDEARKAVELEFEGREAQEGTAKLKWDSKLKLRQTKLAAAGKSLDRSAVLAMYLDEAIVLKEKQVPPIPPEPATAAPRAGRGRRSGLGSSPSAPFLLFSLPSHPPPSARPWLAPSLALLLAPRLVRPAGLTSGQGPISRAGGAARL